MHLHFEQIRIMLTVNLFQICLLWCSTWSYPYTVTLLAENITSLNDTQSTEDSSLFPDNVEISLKATEVVQIMLLEVLIFTMVSLKYHHHHHHNNKRKQFKGYTKKKNIYFMDTSMFFFC